MTRKLALTLRKGDEVVLKETGELLTVMQYYLDADGKTVVLQLCNQYGQSIIEVTHKEVR